ncbi:MAG TPA: guanylate kinase [Myxococcota bacterium]|nr:guanylate kinase [Myxococcota bacterium]
MALRIARPDRGALIVVSGPSGVGKSTLIAHLLDTVPDVAFSVSATTRAPRPGEQDGVHYHFVDAAQFEAWVGEGAFLEHANVYGRRYGTLRAPVEAALTSGRSILLDIDVQGASQVRELLGAGGVTAGDLVSIFILPPDRSVLEARLRGRCTDSEETIQRRLHELDLQIAACGAYDYLVVNDDLDAARATFAGIVLAELSRRRRRDGLVRRWLANATERSA